MYFQTLQKNDHTVTVVANGYWIKRPDRTAYSALVRATVGYTQEKF